MEDPFFESRPIDDLPRFEYLHELAIASTSSLIQDEDLQTIAFNWFERNPRLSRVGIFYNDLGRLVQRGGGDVENLETDWDEDEWSKYQEDNYLPLRIG